MTLLLTILSVIGLIAICWCIAKYNKSDNLFWILLISLFAGMAGGALVNKLKKSNDEKSNVNLEQVYNPTQVSPANCASLYAELGDALAFVANPASEVKEIPARDSKIVTIALSKVFEEIRGQPNFLNPLNKGTPGMPFDTS